MFAIVKRNDVRWFEMYFVFIRMFFKYFYKIKKFFIYILFCFFDCNRLYYLRYFDDIFIYY